MISVASKLLRVVPCCLVAGPGMTKAEEYCILRCSGSDEGGTGLDWLVCISKACSHSPPSKNWVAGKFLFF